MSTPQVIKVNGSSRGDYYKESDFVVANILDSKKLIYGDLPIVYRLYRGDDHQLIRASATSPINNYIFKGKSNNLPAQTKAGVKFEIDPLTGLYNYNKPYTVQVAMPNLWDASPMIANVGPETSISQMCGTGNVMNPVYEKPELRRRGKFKDDYGNSASYFTIGATGAAIDKNADPQTILSAWNAYLISAREHGVNRVIANTKALYIWDGKGSKKITTLAQLAEAFPRYYQFEKQLETEFMRSLGGEKTTNKYFIDGTWYEVQNGYIGLWETFAKRGLSDSAITQELLGAGYTLEQITSIRGVKGLTMYDLQKLTTGNGTQKPGGTGRGTGGGTGTGTGGGGTRGDGSVWRGPEGYRTGEVSEVTVQRSRNVFLGSDQFRDTLVKGNRVIDGSVPIMYQVYMDGSTDVESGVPKINEHRFLLAPQDIQYSNFGGEWVSIERIGGFPFIDWKSFKLLQISFSFVVATKNGPVTGDGLDEPVTRQLEELQRMAQTPFPVMFFGFDGFMTNQFRYDDSGTPRGIQFVIQDLNILAVRRNAEMEITRAQANITLQEIPIERTTLIGMPRLKHKPKTPDEPTTQLDPEYGIWHKNLTNQPDKTLVTPPNGEIG